LTAGIIAVSCGSLAPPVWQAHWISAARAQETDAKGIFHGVGVVAEIDVSTGALTLDHEDIEGLMPAMIMMYRVASPDLSRGLRKGDRIAFDIDAARYTITAVKLLQHAR
jgi:Cu/Ag efflux protein CusF